MHGDGHGFQHGGFGEWDAIRQAMNDSLRNCDVLGEGAGATIVSAGHAQDLATVAEVGFSTTAVSTSSAKNCGIKSDAIAFGPAVNLRAYGRDTPGSFVAHDDRGDAAAGGAVIAVDVAATNPAGGHVDQEFARPRCRCGEVGNFKVPILGKQHCFHGIAISMRPFFCGPARASLLFSYA